VSITINEFVWLSKGIKIRTPNKADKANEQEAKLRRDKGEIDDLRGSIHRPTNAMVQVRLKRRSKEGKRTSPASM